MQLTRGGEPVGVAQAAVVFLGHDLDVEGGRRATVLASETVGIGEREGADAGAECRAAAVADLRRSVERGLLAGECPAGALIALKQGNRFVEERQLGGLAGLFGRIGQAGVGIGLGDAGEFHRGLGGLGEGGVGDIAGGHDSLASIDDYAQADGAGGGFGDLFDFLHADFGGGVGGRRGDGVGLLGAGAAGELEQLGCQFERGSVCGGHYADIPAPGRI